MFGPRYQRVARPLFCGFYEFFDRVVLFDLQHDDDMRVAIHP